MKEILKPWQGWLLGFGLVNGYCLVNRGRYFIPDGTQAGVKCSLSQKTEITDRSIAVLCSPIIISVNIRHGRHHIDRDSHAYIRNGRISIDVLAQRPEMVILWAGMHFLKIILHHVTYVCFWMI